MRYIYVLGSICKWAVSCISNVLSLLNKTASFCNYFMFFFALYLRFCSILHLLYMNSLLGIEWDVTL